MNRGTSRHRRAAVALETAIVLPVFLFLLLALIVGGIGVFRYQQVACLAREGARWGSVRGSLWAIDSGQTAPTQEDILKNAVLPFAVGMDTAQITMRAEWIDGMTGAVTPWDSSRKSTVLLSATNDGVNNKIRITVNYAWSPGVLVPGTVNMTSVSEMVISN
jgi:Flp pilus assembly protein TadG